MMKYKKLFEQGSYKWFAIYNPNKQKSLFIDSNEYLIVNDSEAMILDPGGIEFFSEFVSLISEELDPSKIKYIFSSHQDPDAISSLHLWLEVNPSIKCYSSWLWISFLSHFGAAEKVFISIPDPGMKIQFGNKELEIVPAHYLHSPGNFHLYDPLSKIYFSGDIGAAISYDNLDADIFVKDFDSHIINSKLFHQRWMASNESKREWCERVSKMDIDMLCPQHGFIYTGKDVERFINWFDELKVGVVGSI